MKCYLVCLSIFVLVGCSSAGGVPISPLAQPASPIPTLPEGLVYQPARASSGPSTKSFLPFVVVPGECGMGSVASQIAVLFKTDSNQRRRFVVCDPRLVKAAQYRAEDMNTRHYFNHTDLDHHTPNYWARSFGCQLPGNYQIEGNQIESISLNYPTAQLAWEGWLNSPGHRTHVLGTIPFFGEQVRYGVGYVHGDWGIVYVLITSPIC